MYDRNSIIGMRIMTSGALIMTAYFLLFAAVHSLLADPAFKGRAVDRGYGRWQRPAYNLLSLLMMLPFIAILFLPDRMIYTIPPPWMWAVMAGQILAAGAAIATLHRTGLSRFLGLDQVLRGGDAAGVDELVKGGIYSRVRHPLYVFAILFLWLSPCMTESLLAFNLSATLYFLLGALHEERSLLEQFGQEYEEYRQSVPMFLPRLRS